MNKNDENTRWKQRFDNYLKAFAQLEEAVLLAQKRDLNKLEEQGVIQSFEYTHELAWKCMKDFLFAKGNTEIFGSKDATRAFFQLGLIKDGELWMDMILSRNQSSHTYNQDTAEKIVGKIMNEYYEAFNSFKQELESFL